MADNEFKNPRRPAEPDPKDDDPFAELARIVGYDKDDKPPKHEAEQAAAAQSPEEPPSPVPGMSSERPQDLPQQSPLQPLPEPRVDEGLDLETELLRELDIGVEEPVDLPPQPSTIQSSNTPPAAAPVPQTSVSRETASGSEPTGFSHTTSEAQRAGEIPTGQPATTDPALPASTDPFAAPPLGQQATPEVASASPVQPASSVEPDSTPDPLPEFLRAMRENVETANEPSPSHPGAEQSGGSSDASQTVTGADAGVSDPQPTAAEQSRDAAEAIGTAPDFPPQTHATAEAVSEPKPSTAPDGNPWPSAGQSVSGSHASLEAELEAAFSALEESGTTSSEAAENARREVEAVLPPAEAVEESDELASAYRKFEDDVRAAMPKTASLDDTLEEQLDDVNDMLLAEMAEVEAEASGTTAEQQDMPFDPASIAESDEVPERMAELDVPDIRSEDKAPAATSDDNFGLPLEEELEALASEAAGSADDHREPGESIVEALMEVPPEATPQAQGEDTGLHTSPKATAQLDLPEETLDELRDGAPEDDGFNLDDDLSVPEYDGVEETDHGRSRGRGLVAAFVVVCVAVAGGAGFYFWNSSLGGDSASGEPPVIVADTEPVKVKPADPGGTTVPNQDLAVYDRVAGNGTAEPTDQNLVTTAEEPVDVVQRTLNPEALPLEGRDQVAEPVVKSEERLAASDSTDNAAPAAEDTNGEPTGISPRKVRTLVVKPDGTIVARDLPETPRVISTSLPEQSTETNANAGQGAGTTNQTVALAPAESTSLVQTPPAATDAAAETTQTQSETQAASTTPDSPTNETVPAVGAQSSLPPIDENIRDTGALPVPATKPESENSEPQTVATANDTGTVSTGAGQANAPVPAARPADQPVNIVEAVTERGNLAGSQSAGRPGDYSMQISSQPSEAGARQSYQDLSSRYASILGGRNYNIQRADIPNKGVFYRVRIPVGTRAEATALCNQYKAAGGSCFVAR